MPRRTVGPRPRRWWRQQRQRRGGDGGDGDAAAVLGMPGPLRCGGRLRRPGDARRGNWLLRPSRDVLLRQSRCPGCSFPLGCPSDGGHRRGPVRGQRPFPVLPVPVAFLLRELPQPRDAPFADPSGGPRDPGGQADRVRRSCSSGGGARLSGARTTRGRRRRRRGLRGRRSGRPGRGGARGAGPRPDHRPRRDRARERATAAIRPPPDPADEKDAWRHAPPRHIPSRPATDPRHAGATVRIRHPNPPSSG